LSIRTQLLVYLILLALVDTLIPVPFTAIVLLYVLFQKPQWFREWVDEVYRR
jgi:hypothetical protein